MNFLAHSVLAGDDVGLRIGAFLGDFLKGVDVDALDDDLRAGVELHHALDRYTDAHDAFRSTCTRLRPAFRHYAPVVADVAYDYALSLDWARWTDVPHGEFCARLYADLEDNLARLPDTLRRAAPIMRRNDLLGSYMTLEGTVASLARLSKRTRHGAVLATAGDELGAHVDDIVDEFAAFFPDIVAFAQERR